MSTAFNTWLKQDRLYREYKLLIGNALDLLTPSRPAHVRKQGLEQLQQCLSFKDGAASSSSSSWSYGDTNQVEFNKTQADPTFNIVMALLVDDDQDGGKGANVSWDCPLTVSVLQAACAASHECREAAWRLGLVQRVATAWRDKAVVIDEGLVDLVLAMCIDHRGNQERVITSSLLQHVKDVMWDKREANEVRLACAKFIVIFLVYLCDRVDESRRQSWTASVGFTPSFYAFCTSLATLPPTPSEKGLDLTPDLRRLLDYCD